MPFHSDDFKKIFVENTGLLTEEALAKALANAEKTRRPVEQVLMERAFVSPQQYLQLLSAYCGVPATDLRVADVDRKVLHLIPEALAEKCMAIPFAIEGNTVHVAFADPLDQSAQYELQQALLHSIQPYVTTQQFIQRALVLYDGDIAEILRKAVEQGVGTSPDNGAKKVIDTIIETAILLDASDVHIEPFEDTVLVRMRIDGLLRPIAEMPVSLLSPVLAQLKIRSELRVDEHRLPQDGRFSQNVKGQEVNVRVSTVPSLWGEKAVLRILPKEAHLLDINHVGFLESDLVRIRNYIKRPYGMVLVCGPTGSGKTTTLYAFLQEISSERIDVVNISTIEDPIEYTVPRVTQIQTQPEINLTFAAGLRALLRQDPDIIMVGEIRDTETADFAVRASLVGRLVLSSLHTNDAVGAIPRLLDMGVEPYLVSSTLSLVIAQRLARKLCTYCRQSFVPDRAILDDLRQHHNFDQAMAMLIQSGEVSAKTKMSQLRFFKSVGCDHCNHTGYSGRSAIYEIMEVSDALRKQIASHENAITLRQTATNEGMKSMFADGLAKVLLGLTDIDELLRVVYS